MPAAQPSRRRATVRLMEDGSTDVLVLAYPCRSGTDLWITLGGCREVSNGDVSAAGP